MTTSPSTSPSTSPDTAAEAIATSWMAFWNGDLDLAADLLSPDFRIHFGGAADWHDPDAIRGPQAMADYAAAYFEHFSHPAFTLDEVLPSTAGFAMRWTVAIGEQVLSGVDVVHLDGDRMSRVWSVTGERQLPAR